MLLPTKASGLPRNSATSIWSSDTLGGCTDLAMRLSESPGRTWYLSPAAAAVAAAGAAGGAATALGAGAGASGRGAARRSGLGAGAATAGGGAAWATRGVGCIGAGGGTGAAEMAGATLGAGAAAMLRGVPGGSSSIVYSRTRRPLAQFISRITSTKGSTTARSLVTRR